jgi:hypothetical protein
MLIPDAVAQKKRRRSRGRKASGEGDIAAAGESAARGDGQ